MKKTLSVLFSLCLCTAVFTGCNDTNAASFQDGTYKAVYAQADDHGWTEYLTLTVEDGKIVSADFDAENDDGAKKSENTEYNEAMKNAGSKTWPSAFYPALEKSLIEKQDGNGIDAVSGATTSSESLKKLYQALVPNMKKGDTTEVKVNS